MKSNKKIAAGVAAVALAATTGAFVIPAALAADISDYTLTVEGQTVPVTQCVPGQVTKSVEVEDLASVTGRFDSYHGNGAAASLVSSNATDTSKTYTFSFDVPADILDVNTECTFVFNQKPKADPNADKASLSSININNHEVTFGAGTEATVNVEGLDGIDGTVLGSAGYGDVALTNTIKSDKGVQFTYTVTSADGTNKVDYFVNFLNTAQVPSSAAYLTQLVLDGYTINRDDFTTTENGKNEVTIKVDSLDAIKGDEQAISFMGANAFQSGSVEGDTHKAFYYTVVAEDGSQADYVIDFVLNNAEVDPANPEDNNDSDNESKDDEAKPAEETKDAAKADTNADAQNDELAQTGTAVAGGIAATVFALVAGVAFAVLRVRRVF